jgi:threonine dehydrogenase-like Zn-dependent dehydrogenase
LPCFATHREYETWKKAVVLEETRKIVVREVPDAEIRETTDVLLRLTSTAICGTDLHFFEGRMPGLEARLSATNPSAL